MLTGRGFRRKAAPRSTGARASDARIPIDSKGRVRYPLLKLKMASIFNYVPRKEPSVTHPFPATSRTRTDASQRAFVMDPAGLGATEDAPLRRIWDVEPDALVVVAGVLLSRADLEALLREVEHEDCTGTADDALLSNVVARCSRPCAFAEGVEGLLDRRTRCVRQRLEGCPMSELAGLWLGARERATGDQLAALLWSLASDERWLIRGLCERVRGDLWVRALRLLSPKNSLPGPVQGGETTGERTSRD